MTHMTSRKEKVRLHTTIIYKNTKIDQVINNYDQSKYKEFSPYQFTKYHNKNNSSFRLKFVDQVINDYVRSKYKEYSPYQFIKYYNQNSSSFKQDGVPYFLYPSFTVALSCRRRRNARLDTTLCISKQRVL